MNCSSDSRSFALQLSDILSAALKDQTLEAHYRCQNISDLSELPSFWTVQGGVFLCPDDGNSPDGPRPEAVYTGYACALADR